MIDLKTLPSGSSTMTLPEPVLPATDEEGYVTPAADWARRRPYPR